MFPPLHLLHVYSETLVKGHGRIEKRIYTLDTDIGWFADRKQRKGLAAFRKCESHVTRTKSGKESVETRYFITTLTDVEEFARAVRSHWAIKNNLHWSLDVLFHDDDYPVLDRNTGYKRFSK